MDNKKDIDIEELLKKAEAEQNNKDNSQDSNAKEEEKTEDNSNPKNETDADNATESQCDTEKTAEKTDPLAEAQAQIERLGEGKEHEERKQQQRGQDIQIGADGFK